MALGVVSAIRTDSRGADRDQEGGGVEYGQIAAAEAGIERCPGKRRGKAAGSGHRRARPSGYSGPSSGSG